MSARIAIIGAGLSGLVAASRLNASCDVTIFEKSGGYGGRMATRRADPFAFDHGAQYFTVKSPAFEAFLEPYRKIGAVNRWDARLVALEGGKAEARQRSDAVYVASPGMNGLAKQLADGLNVQLQTPIERIEGEAGNWTLVDQEGQPYGQFEWVVCSAPAPQILRQIPSVFSGTDRLKAVEMDPGFTLMLGFGEPLNLPFDGAFVGDSAIGFVAVNLAKPGRGKATSLVVQSTNAWAARHVDHERDKVVADLLHELERVTGRAIPAPEYQTIHRWLFANVRTPAGTPFLMDRDSQLAACGDWCIRGRVEAAFESGNKLANALLTHLDA